MIEFKAMLGPYSDYPVGSSKWAERISAVLQNRVKDINHQTAPYLTKHLREIFTKTPKPWSVWPDPPYNTPDDYCKDVTGHKWDEIISLVAKFAGDEKLELMMRSELGRTQAKYRKRGRPSKENAAVGRHKIKGQGSNNSQRLLRRIARDYPQILKAYEAGEYRSVRAAAIEAGIIKIPTSFERTEKNILKGRSEWNTRQKKHLIKLLEEVTKR